MLEIKNIEKSYKNFHLGKINLNLEPGYIMGLIGENGAGKTTLMKILLNLVRAEKGTVSVFGMDHDKEELKIKDRIGFVFEENPYYENLKPSQIATILSLAYSRWDWNHYRDLVKQFGLSEKPLGKLSKGQKMIFSFIVALSHHAELLLLDEPTAGLDPVVRREFLNELHNYLAGGDRSVFFSTHITSDLEQVADKIAFLHKGKILFSEDVDELSSTYHLVRAEKSLLTKLDLIGYEEKKTHAIGVYEGDRSDLETLPCSVESASLEDIMYFATRGRHV